MTMDFETVIDSIGLPSVSNTNNVVYTEIVILKENPNTSFTISR